MTAPHVPAAFINAIAEEGTKEEAVSFLQKQWNENCQLRAQLAEWKQAASVEAGLRREFLARAEAAEAHLQTARKALEEIAEGKGRFSLDHHEHACNTIEDMKALAIDALRPLDGAGK